MPRKKRNRPDGGVVPKKKGVTMKAGSFKKAARVVKKAAQNQKRQNRRSKAKAANNLPEAVQKQFSMLDIQLSGESTKIERNWGKKLRREETITPQVAREYLRRNTNNRPVNKEWVFELRDDILNNRWRTTHQGIAFHHSGILADGQHRLLACVLSGQPIKIMVSYGLTDEERDAIDRGKKRTAAHLAAIRTRTRGEAVTKYLTQRTAVARQVLKGLGQSRKTRSSRNHLNIVLFMEKYTDLITDYVEISQRGELRTIYHSGWVASFCMAAIIHGRQLVDQLLRQLHDAKPDDQSEHPMAALRRTLTKQRGQRSSVYYAYGVAALTAALRGENRKQIKGGTLDFPEALSIREEFFGE